MSNEWTPIDHRPPLPHIDLQPVRKPSVEPAKSFWELQAEVEEEARLKREAERIWELVRSVGEGTGSAA